MPIVNQRFRPSERSYESSALSGDSASSCRLQCHACGYEVVDAIAPPSRCPKCTGGAWERVPFPASLLIYIDQPEDDIQRVLMARNCAV